MISASCEGYEVIVQVYFGIFQRVLWSFVLLLYWCCIFVLLAVAISTGKQSSRFGHMGMLTSQSNCPVVAWGSDIFRLSRFKSQVAL